MPAAGAIDGRINLVRAIGRPPGSWPAADQPTAAGFDARAEIACSTPRGFGSSEMLAVDPALFKELSTKPAAAANMPAVNE